MECFIKVYFHGPIPVTYCHEQEKTTPVIPSYGGKSGIMVFMEFYGIWSILCSIMFCGCTCTRMDNCRDLANYNHIRFFISSSFLRNNSNIRRPSIRKEVKYR